MNELYRFRVVGIFVETLIHIIPHHIVEGLKDVSNIQMRFVGDNFEEILKGDELILAPITHRPIEVVHRLNNIVVHILII